MLTLREDHLQVVADLDALAYAAFDAKLGGDPAKANSHKRRTICNPKKMPSSTFPRTA
jgi:hypothetical protein